MWMKMKNFFFIFSEHNDEAKRAKKNRKKERSKGKKR